MTARTAQKKNLLHLFVRAGDGGNGCESYYHRRDKKIVMHGGDGGKGGSVIFRADSNAPPLSSLRYKQHLIAESGGHGGSNRKRGKNGGDLIVLVPRGTRIYDRQRNLLIRDLLKDGEEVVVCAGGHGGNGNQGGKEVTAGSKGGRMEIELDIQIVADIFLVGLPNAGKSRLLNALTRAHAKEEDYPFTTTEPQMGVYVLSDYEQLTLCELPSLYRASHEGRGMGTAFLKHLERARRILYVIDPVSNFSGSLKEGLETLRQEVGLFQETFLKLPHAIVVNKMDLEEARKKAKREEFSPGVPLFYVSARTGEGLEALKNYLGEMRDNF